MSKGTFSWPRVAALAVLLSGLGLIATGCGGHVGYELPPEPADYRLTFDYENVQTEWRFNSSVVSTDATPEGYVCIEASLAEAGEATKPCRPEPLIFLRYDAGVGLDNKVRAGRSDEIRVIAYRQAPAGPKIAGLRLWVSTDDGAEWDQVKAKSRGEGVFEADVRYPRFSRTTGAVSLKAEAWDVDGNRVEQTITRAFGLRDGSGDDDDDDD